MIKAEIWKYQGSNMKLFENQGRGQIYVQSRKSVGGREDFQASNQCSIFCGFSGKHCKTIPFFGTNHVLKKVAFNSSHMRFTLNAGV